MKRAVVIAVFLSLAAIPTVAIAQEDGPGPLTWIAYSKVKPGKTGDAVAMTVEEADLLDGLMADGTVLSWGLATPVNHRPGQSWNHAQWVTLPNWEAVETWVGAVFQRMDAMNEEERAADEARFTEIYEPGSHFDVVVRQLISNSGDGAGPPRYFLGGSYRAKPGKEEDVVKLYKDFVVPIADRLVVDGVVSGYGLSTEELHGDHSFTHRSWFAIPGLSAIDEIQAAFASAGGPGIQAWAESVFEPDAHGDLVFLILHLGGQGGDE